MLSQDNSFYHYITQSDCLREDLLNDSLPLLDDIYTFMSIFFIHRTLFYLSALMKLYIGLHVNTDCLT